MSTELTFTIITVLLSLGLLILNSRINNIRNEVELHILALSVLTSKINELERDKD